MKKVLVMSSAALMFACSSMFANAEALYKSCGACHGAKAEKSALGASKIINTMSKDDIAKALQGYKTDTYGGAKKAIMKGQVAKLTSAQIDELAGYIATLK